MKAKNESKLVDIQNCVNKLKQLLDKPELGLVSWHLMVQDKMEELNKIYNEK